MEEEQFHLGEIHQCVAGYPDCHSFLSRSGIYHRYPSHQRIEGVNIFEKAHYIGLFSLQVFCQLSIAFLLGLLIRKAFIAYGIYIFYSFILENILSGFFRLKSKKWGIDYGHYLPFEISDRLIPLPPSIGKFNAADNQLAIAAINIHVVYTLALTAFVWLLSFYIFKKRDL